MCGETRGVAHHLVSKPTASRAVWQLGKTEKTTRLAMPQSQLIDPKAPATWFET